MRRTVERLFRLLVLALVLGVGVASTSPVFADERSEARTHYQAGVKFYNAGDYRSAIREFSAAQQRVPADLNNYNLALCYDKLGDAEPAVQYYRAFLDKNPQSDKRAEIEASVARLEAASKSVSSKKAEEAKKAAAEAKAAEEAKKADEAKKAEEAKKADAAKKPVEESTDGMVGGVVGGSVGATVGGGSTGSPSTGVPVATGDSQLDRVQAIDIDAIRNQRMNTGAAGMVDPRNPQGANNPNANDPNAPNQYGGRPNPPDPRVAQANNQNPNQNQATNGQPLDQQPPPKADPVYKKWWFWAIVAVGAYVAYQIVSEDSSDYQTRTLPLSPPADVGGAALFRW